MKPVAKFLTLFSLRPSWLLILFILFAQLVDLCFVKKYLFEFYQLSSVSLWWPDMTLTQGWTEIMELKDKFKLAPRSSKCPVFMVGNWI